jgi:hypothetical protein
MGIKGCGFCTLVKDCLTGIDGESYDIARVSWVVTTMLISMGEIWNTYKGNHFDTQEFAAGIAILAAAHGAAIFAKKDTEPKQREEHHAD